MAKSKRASARAEPKVNNTPRYEGDPEEIDCFGLYRVINQGWITVRARIPRDVVEKYAIKVTDPELKQVAVAKLTRDIERSQ